MGMARVLLGVTGGIAAYKACELTRRFVRAGHEVIPIVTHGAERFVTPRDLHGARQPAARREPLSAPDSGRPPRHRTADREHAGQAGARARRRRPHRGRARARGPVLVAPAMNDRMWAHPATQANAELLRSGVSSLPARSRASSPRAGEGLGRMAEPEEIFERMRGAARRMSGSLAGKRVLVTAGGTREPLDAVRYIGNRSSGRMGVALAAEARRRGADVTLHRVEPRRAGPGRTSRLSRRRRPRTSSARAESRADADVVIMAAAVSDYRPAETEAAKRPKDEIDVADRARADHRRARSSSVSTARTARCCRLRRGDRRGRPRARAREAGDKQVDLIVYNDVSREDIGFDADDNEVVIVSGGGERRVDKAPKDEIAAAILDEVERLT